jgi:predicted secreted Zn-dependent protease
LGHYKYGQQAVKAVDKAILDMPAMKDCKALEKAVAQRANTISDEYTLRSRQYDVNTDHGRTQGAWLTL